MPQRRSRKARRSAAPSRSSQAAASAPRSAYRPWAPFVIPYVLFLTLTFFEKQGSAAYPTIYAVKIFIVALAAWIYRPTPPDAFGLRFGRMQASHVAAAVALGAVLTAIWVKVDPVTPHFAALSSRVAYNPFHAIHDTLTRTLFLAVRFIGLAVVLPWVEELFFRGFLLRYMTDPVDWKDKEVGLFGPGSLAINVLLFASIHPEWLVAAIFAAAMAGLLRWTKDVRVCFLAHAVCNLLLGVYIIHTGDWKYW